MPTDQEKFIADLVKGHGKVNRLPAYWLLGAGFWFIFGGLIFGFMVMIQGGRPGLLKQLAAYPFTFMELLFGVAAGLLLMMHGFRQSIPDLKGRHLMNPGLLLFVGTLGSLVANETGAGGLSVYEGARPFCEFEVLLYGLIGLAPALWLLRKGYFEMTLPNMATVVLGISLTPALLMQQVCSYTTQHGLVFHYGPIGVLLLIALGIQAKNHISGD